MGEESGTLERFVKAQEPVIASVVAELVRGRKEGHWMWFIFPQLRGLGHSAMSHYYGIRDAEEAAAYLAHPVLGARLKGCCWLALSHAGRSAEAIFGAVDAMKLRSCATLFAAVPEADPVFAELLKAFFAGEPDPLTRARLIAL